MVKGVVSRVEEAFSYLKEFNITSVMVRLLLAVISGALIGYGREKKERNAGLRTYMLISIGSALTILISFYENEMLNGAWQPVVELVGKKFDASRFSAQVLPTGTEGMIGVSSEGSPA